MMQALILLLGAALLVQRAPDLPLSRLLEAWLAERPARWLSRRTRQELIAWAIVAALVAFAGEYVLVIGGPQIAMGVAVDLAAYVDAAIALATLASVARVQTAARWFRLKTGARRPRARASCSRPASRAPANDSDDGPARLAA